MKKFLLTLAIVVCGTLSFAQNTFPYSVQLTPVQIPNLPGLHSFAFGQHQGQWLLIGGRKDGIHARQPFNAFPESENNTTLYVVDIATREVWSAPTTSLPTPIREQLQSTNMNFHQDGDSLYLIGGYAFSASANDHITFDKLTALDVPKVIDAVRNGTSLTPYFKQISNPIFQNTGGQLGKIGDSFYLVGGQVFTGRYNPMNHPTFEQTYVSKIQKFTISNTANELRMANYSAVTDAVHLRRRDYNLVPQVFPNGEEGYTISSGVFQINSDLPFLYPVDVKASGYEPQTQFSQYLSNYHSGKISLYTQNDGAMHSLFFGGISQYYYNGTTLVRDENVPFVKTISRITRLADGTLTEYKCKEELPNWQGAGAEFIPNSQLPHYQNEVIQLDSIPAKEFVLGHLCGGIQSKLRDAFTTNETEATTADAAIYEVKLVYNPTADALALDGVTPFSFSAVTKPAINKKVTLEFTMPYKTGVDFFVTGTDGTLEDDGEIVKTVVGANSMVFNLAKAKSKTVVITLVFDKNYYISQKVVLD